MNTSAPLADIPIASKEHERPYRFWAAASFAALIAVFVLLPYGHLYPPIYVMGFLAALALACCLGTSVAVVVYFRSRRLERSYAVPSIVLAVVSLTATINLTYLLSNANPVLSPCLVGCQIFAGFVYAGTMVAMDETKGRFL